MATAVPVTHPPSAALTAAAASGAPGRSRPRLRLAAFARGGWRPALGWALTPCALYAFIVGPCLGRPADTAQLVALFGAAGVLVAARSFEKTRGLV